ncbi:kinase-like domain-containing protein [Rhizophagus irregularis DAOM 181602=DAOM 197198]|nr:kinase-like domain-containing protein [Rhizophagus irregularis DAOM 181602=DAOM 197198]
MEWERKPNEKVTLICLNNSQITTDEFLNKIKTYIDEKHIRNYVSNNITEEYLYGQIRSYSSIAINKEDIEWMPYYRFGNIKKVNKSDTTLQYSAIWMNGPLKYNGIKWERIPNKKVTLKYLCSSQNITNEILNEVNSYFIKVNNLPLNQPTDYSRILHPTKDISPKIYGISQNPITRDYFIVIKVYSALWENGPLQYNTNYEGLERDHSIEVALKCLHDSQNISNGLLNEVKNYSINHNKILKIYGISQNPITKDYIIVLQLASEGFVNSRYIKKPWYRIEKLYILYKIIDCLEIIHNNQTVHRDLHIGNILILPSDQFSDDICIMDMGLCKEVDNISNTVYGVMPYVAPEILRGKPYTQAADIYSFALNICNGIRPEINEQEAPKCYIELMKKCWSSNPDDRPKAIEIKEEINKQIEEAIRNKKFRFLNIGSNQSTVHPKACYTSRLLNPFTKNLPK